MEKLLEIIEQLRQVTEWSQPNIKYVETIALINELEEEIKNPKQPEIAEAVEPTVETPPVIEATTVDEPVVEAPKVEEPEAPKKRNYHFKKKEKPVE